MNKTFFFFFFFVVMNMGNPTLIMRYYEIKGVMTFYSVYYDCIPRFRTFRFMVKINA